MSAHAFRAAIIGRLALWSGSLFLVTAAFSGVLAAVFAFHLWPRTGTVAGWHDVLVQLAVVSFIVFFVDLMVAHRFLVPARVVVERPLGAARVHLALTAFRDEEAIAGSVRDFKANPRVDRLIVVDNDSGDGTAAAAREAGADLVVVETRRGYGSCCMRAMAEAAEGADVIVLCEGDMTFSGQDVQKLLAYLDNCDLVLGTRATQELRQPGTQMDWLMNPANQLVAKLAQIRFWGTRLTDVGCTYRAIRVDAYRQLAPHLHVTGNHFSPHMYIEALKLRMRVIEIPVVFQKRVGESKGVGANRWRATRVALAMLRLIYTA
jgi:hypothetical protein